MFLLTGCGDVGTGLVTFYPFGPVDFILWPKATIPYVIDSKTVGDEQRVEILDAMKEWHERTGIYFVEHTSEFNYVKIVNYPTGCLSNIGMTGGQQTLILADLCNFGAILHELGHTIGLIHEQCRADRDAYVEINWKNIELENRHNFYIENGYPLIGPYDIDSVMQYDSYNFAIDYSYPTITIKNKKGLDSLIPDNVDLSEWDVKKVKRLYYGHD